MLFNIQGSEMRSARGFTLIELVIVIVILGILGAVAAPRFINMQRDAYIANLQALKGSVEAAAILGHTKAILNGYDTRVEFTLADSSNNFQRSLDGNYEDEKYVVFRFGYPEASGNGIIRMLNRAEDFTFDYYGDSTFTYSQVVDGGNTILRISLRTRLLDYSGDDAKKCELTYQQPNAVGEQPKITLYTQGC